MTTVPATTRPETQRPPTTRLEEPVPRPDEVDNGGWVPFPRESYTPVLESANCPTGFEMFGSVNCGVLKVPLDRLDVTRFPAAEIFVVILPAREAATEPPLFMIEGGPGGEAVSKLPLVYEQFSALNTNRTLVFHDPRGVGLSKPVLDCPEVDTLVYDLVEEGASVEAGRDRFVQTLQVCKQEWEAAGLTDLSVFSTANAAADIVDLAGALGAKSWDVYGVSYGTRVALTIMRDYPSGVGRVVLDSVYPHHVDSVAELLPGVVAAFGEVNTWCAADPVCATSYGDLGVLFSETRARLSENPDSSLEVSHPERGLVSATLLSEDLPGLLVTALHTNAAEGELPLLLRQVSEGDMFRAQGLVEQSLLQYEFLSVGHHTTVTCREETPFTDWPATKRAERQYAQWASLSQGTVSQGPYAAAFCAGWVEAAPPVENLPVVSDIEVLLTAGRFDPVTPPEWAVSAAEFLSNSHVVVFPYLSHVSAVGGECQLEVTDSFLRTGTPDLSCVEDMSPPVAAVESPPTVGEWTRYEPELAGLAGFSVAVPADWESPIPGFYQRSAADPTWLLVQVSPLGPAAAPSVLSYLGAESWDEGSLVSAPEGWAKQVTLRNHSAVHVAWKHPDTSTAGLLVIMVTSRDDAALAEAQVLDPVLWSATFPNE